MSEELALIDWATITLIAVFGITGFFNGFIKELFSAAAWIVSLALSWLYGPLLFFGALKTVAVLSSIFIFNLSYLDTNKWWIDSYSRIYSIKFYEYSKPVFDEWINKADTILQKDNSKITL